MKSVSSATSKFKPNWENGFKQSECFDAHLRDKASRLQNVGTFSALVWAAYYNHMAFRLASCREFRRSGYGRSCNKHAFCPLCYRANVWNQAKKVKGSVGNVLRDEPQLKGYWITLSMPETRDLRLAAEIALREIRPFLKEFTKASSWRLDIKWEFPNWFVHFHLLAFTADIEELRTLKEHWALRITELLARAGVVIEDSKAFNRRQKVKPLLCYQESPDPGLLDIASDSANVVKYLEHGSLDDEGDSVAPPIRLKIFKAIRSIGKVAGLKRTYGCTGLLHGRSRAQNLNRRMELVNHTLTLKLLNRIPVKASIGPSSLKSPMLV